MGEHYTKTKLLSLNEPTANIHSVSQSVCLSVGLSVCPSVRSSVVSQSLSQSVVSQHTCHDVHGGGAQL